MEASFENRKMEKVKHLIKVAHCLCKISGPVTACVETEQYECLQDVQSRLSRPLLNLLLVAYLAAGRSIIPTPCCDITQQ